MPASRASRASRAKARAAGADDVADLVGRDLHRLGGVHVVGTDLHERRQAGTELLLVEDFHTGLDAALGWLDNRDRAPKLSCGLEVRVGFSRLNVLIPGAGILIAADGRCSAPRIRS